MSPRIVLVGLPAAGKTTAGRRLARRLSLPFADSDFLVVQRTGRRIAEIFDTDGEAAFRELEHEAVIGALGDFNGVLALGGGAVLCGETRAALRAADVPVAHLMTTAAWAIRYVGTGRSRPLLRGNAAVALAELERVRAPLYAEVATVEIPSAGRSIAEVVDDLVQVLERHPHSGTARSAS